MPTFRFRRAPAIVFNVPRGQTHPQKMRPMEDRQHNHDEGEIKRDGSRMGRQERRHEDEGIEVEKEPDGIAQLVIPLRFRLDKEEKKEDEKEPWDTLRACCRESILFT
ncbi:MAG: hypothetical protein MZU91_05265 [Desulfosudis oleivorans]|nr:hypothetical protein [Desulfosudis oleivorans]